MSVYKRYLEEFSLEESELVVNLDDFEMGDVIGKGGFGQVRRAIYKKTGIECGIKQIFTERLEGNRFRRYIGEIETLARCDNMFLVPFIGFTAQPPYAIVTEFMPNGSLDKYVRKKPGVQPLSGTQLTAIAIGIAHGMVHLHSIGIIHRDLKAANILLDSRLFPRICDFGIARFEEHGSSGMTAKIGTPNYMAPELIQSNDYDRKVDVYAFAMILYEMNENQRPFKSIKDVNEIFKAVIQRNERPEFSKATPPAMQKLIKRCWERDPELRPTFDEIFDILASGKVAFPDTKRIDITKFLKIIEKDEERRDELAKLREKKQAKKNGEKVDQTSSTYSYEESDEIIDNKLGRDQSDSDSYENDEPIPIPDEEIPAKPPQKSTKQQQQKQQPQQQRQPQKQQKEQNVKAKQPEKKKPQDNSSDSKKDSTKSSSQNEDPDVVLRDYNHPQFQDYLDFYARSIIINQFSSFYDLISLHFNKKTPANVLNSIYKACYALMKREKKFIASFNEENFFIKLPVEEKTIDSVIDCISLLFIDAPKYLGQDHCAMIKSLMELRPEKMLILYSFYIKNLLSLANPWPILDNLFGVLHTLTNTTCGYLYLSIYHYLITNYEVYAKERTTYIKSIFLMYVNSRDVRTINAAYNGLALIYNDVTELDYTRTAAHLLEDSLWQSVIALLIRIDKIPPSETLLNALIYRTNESPLPWIVILNMANGKKGPEFFLQNTQWLEEEKKHPIEVMRVFLVVFKDKANREKASNLPLFPALLRDALTADPRRMHFVVSSTIRRAALTPALINRLSQENVLKKYIEITNESDKQRIVSNALSTIDKLSRVCFVKDFIDFIDTLVTLLSQNNEHATEAITVIVSLSFYPECCKTLKQKDLVPYFEKLTKYEKFKKMAEAFLINAKKV